MLNRQIVTRDVALAIRDIVVDWTPFTYKDPDESKQGYRRDLVPSADLWDGWLADRGNWGLVLNKIEDRLHNTKPEYSVLHITAANIKDTLGVKLSQTQTLLANKIIDGNLAIAGVTEANSEASSSSSGEG